MNVNPCALPFLPVDDRLDLIDLAAWERDGYLHVPAVLDAAQLDDLRSWVADVADRPAGRSGLLQHYERTETGVQIARSENLAPGHAGFSSLVGEGLIPAMGARLVGEPVVIYKEKINYKLAGGAGFAPHQDAPAYKFVDVHVTCMLAIDDASAANGGLELVSNRHHELLPDDGDGCIHPDVVADLEWHHVDARAGDLLWFHSLVPHRSGPNTSSATRRALFCTYNARSQGDLREAYYADKIAYLADRGAGSARVSTIGDFLGISPTADELREIGVQR